MKVVVVVVPMIATIPIPPKIRTVTMLTLVMRMMLLRVL